MSLILENMVTEHINNKYPDDKDAEELKEYLVQKIKDEVCNEKLTELTNEAIKKAEVKQIKEKIRGYKTLVCESAFLAFFIGMFVNQCTTIVVDIQSKVDVSISQIIWSFILFILCLILVFIIRGNYIFKISDSDLEKLVR